MKKLLSGIQPTNNLTLGNYLGAISNFVKLQENYQNFIFVADLHALTNDFKTDLNVSSHEIVKYYLAAGLDVNKTIIFKQSDIIHHTFLFYLLTCNTTIGELSRMTQFKDKSMKIKNPNNTEYIPTGLLVYPTLMAADILLYQPDIVVVGSDQKQHLELTRNIAIRINNKLKTPFFKIPEPYIATNGARIMDLIDPTKKMSKSSDNSKGVIFLSDSSTVIRKKIMGALTDNLNQVVYDLKNQPGVSNLITIYHLLSGLSINEIEKKYKGISNYGIFKKDLSDIVCQFVSELQQKKSAITDDMVRDVLMIGKEKAQKIADQYLQEFKKIMRL